MVATIQSFIAEHKRDHTLYEAIIAVAVIALGVGMYFTSSYSTPVGEYHGFTTENIAPVTR